LRPSTSSPRCERSDASSHRRRFSRRARTVRAGTARFQRRGVFHPFRLHPKRESRAQPMRARSGSLERAPGSLSSFASWFADPPRVAPARGYPGRRARRWKSLHHPCSVIGRPLSPLRHRLALSRARQLTPPPAASCFHTTSRRARLSAVARAFTRRSRFRRTPRRTRTPFAVSCSHETNPVSRSRCLRSEKLSSELRAPRSPRLRRLLERGVSLPETPPSTRLEAPGRPSAKEDRRAPREMRPTDDMQPTISTRAITPRDSHDSFCVDTRPVRCCREHGVSRCRTHFDPSESPIERRVLPPDKPLGRVSDASSPLVPAARVTPRPVRSVETDDLRAA